MTVLLCTTTAIPTWPTGANITQADARSLQLTGAWMPLRLMSKRDGQVHPTFRGLERARLARVGPPARGRRGAAAPGSPVAHAKWPRPLAQQRSPRPHLVAHLRLVHGGGRSGGAPPHTYAGGAPRPRTRRRCGPAPLHAHLGHHRRMHRRRRATSQIYLYRSLHSVRVESEPGGRGS